MPLCACSNLVCALLSPLLCRRRRRRAAAAAQVRHEKRLLDSVAEAAGSPAAAAAASKKASAAAASAAAIAAETGRTKKALNRGALRLALSLGSTGPVNLKREKLKDVAKVCACMKNGGRGGRFLHGLFEYRRRPRGPASLMLPHSSLFQPPAPTQAVGLSRFLSF